MTTGCLTSVLESSLLTHPEIYLPKQDTDFSFLEHTKVSCLELLIESPKCFATKAQILTLGKLGYEAENPHVLTFSHCYDMSASKDRPLSTNFRLSLNGPSLLRELGTMWVS